MEYKLIKLLQKLNVKPPPHPSMINNTKDTFIK
jgi:hypothetical protein